MDSITLDELSHSISELTEDSVVYFEDYLGNTTKDLDFHQNLPGTELEHIDTYSGIGGVSRRLAGMYSQNRANEGFSLLRGTRLSDSAN